MARKVTTDDIAHRLLEVFGGIVTIAAGQQYVSMLDPMTFVDRDYGEWTTSPNNVVNKKCTHPSRKLEKRKATNIATYGVDNPFKSEKVKTRIKQTLKDRYGEDHPSKCPQLREKVRKTCQEKYEADSPLESPVVLGRIKATMMERYNTTVPMHVQGIKDKARETSQEHYGTDNPMQNPVVREKTSQTNQGRYGGAAPMCDVTVRKKTFETNIGRYGGAAPMCSDVVKDKAAATCLSIYGVTNPFSAPEIKVKITKIIQERFGVDHPAQNAGVRDKMSETCRNRFGSNSPLELGEIRSKIRQTLIDNGDIICVPDGTPLSDYIQKWDKTEALNYTSCRYVLKNFGFATLQEYVEQGKTFGITTDIEARASVLLGVERFLKNFGRKKPDFKLSDTLYLDVDGLWWHAETRQPDSEYHFNKRKHYEQRGCRIIQFRANELVNSPNVIKSIIDNALGRSQRVYARKCELEKIPWTVAKDFLSENHLQGAGAPSTPYALLDSDGVAQLLTIRRSDDGVEIARLCSRIGATVVGGFSRLLSAAIADYNPKFVLSWCDLRYASGRGYESVGFVGVRDVQGWAWTDYKDVYNRLRCRANMDERELTQEEHAFELGWVKIYDAGQRLYMKSI